MQTPLVRNSKVFGPASVIPPSPSFDGSPLLGFCHMVAPINKVEGTKGALSQGEPLPGDVHQLLGGENAPPSVAPALPDLLRQILEGRQIKASTINSFLTKNKSLKRYSSSFRLLWNVLVQGGVHPPRASEDQIADAVVQIFAVSPAQARNAYSAVLLIPGLGGLRFHPLLGPYKKEWNQNVEKYGIFWDPTDILLALQSTSFQLLRENISLLRTQFIICARLLCLYRSSDLASLKRTVSIMGGKIPFIKIKRKGQKMPKWERMVSIPSCPQISPFHLLKEYVALTRREGKLGGPVLLTLKPPFKPILADTVASITNFFLEKFGISSKIWGPHSTRGAGVGFMRKLGLSADEVCEIGKWKGVEAFAAHYQRLGAQEKLEDKVLHALAPPGVHSQTSPRGSAEHEVSRTPPRRTERGGRDTECEAQSLGEVMPCLPAVFSCFSS